MSNIDQIIRRIRSIQRGRGNYLLTLEAELRQRAHHPALQEDLQKIYVAFEEDMLLISKVIKMGLTDTDILRHELDHRFRFEYTLCESAITAYSKDEQFVTWLIISVHDKSSAQARRLFSLVVTDLSDDSLWMIEEATDDPHISTTLTPEMTKRHMAYLKSVEHTAVALS